MIHCHCSLSACFLSHRAALSKQPAAAVAAVCIQGSEFLEGFSGGASGGGGMAGRGRCFKCGQAGHWETDCPLNAAAIAAQEAEMAAWRTAQLEKEREAVQGQGQGMPADPAATAAEAGDAVAGGGPAAAGYPKHKAAAAQQAPAAPPPPLSHAELCSIVGQDASQPWQPEQLTDDQLRVMLKSVWGYEQFRGQQLPLIRAALQGRSMLGVLPTGLGKSLTYQLPAILLQGEGHTNLGLCRHACCHGLCCKAFSKHSAGILVAAALYSSMMQPTMQLSVKHTIISAGVASTSGDVVPSHHTFAEYRHCLQVLLWWCRPCLH